MSLRLIDPGGPQEGGAERTRAPRLASLDGKRIGLLTNGKHNADVLLQETAAIFEKEHGCTVVELTGKAHAGKPADPGLLARLAKETDFLLTAAGD